MELMFDMQQYGQPPAEIIKDLAPGLQFDENGMPIMPNMVSLSHSPLLGTTPPHSQQHNISCCYQIKLSVVYCLLFVGAGYDAWRAGVPRNERRGRADGRGTVCCHVISPLVSRAGTRFKTWKVQQ